MILLYVISFILTPPLAIIAAIYTFWVACDLVGVERPVAKRTLAIVVNVGLLGLMVSMILGYLYRAICGPKENPYGGVWQLIGVLGAVLNAPIAVSVYTEMIPRLSIPIGIKLYVVHSLSGLLLGLLVWGVLAATKLI